LIALLRERNAEDTTIKLGPDRVAIDASRQAQLAFKAAVVLF
jgi:hypothetical protein